MPASLLEQALASGRLALLAITSGDLDAFQQSWDHHEFHCRAIENARLPHTPETANVLNEIIAIDGEISAAATRASSEALQRMAVLRRASRANAAYASANESR